MGRKPATAGWAAGLGADLDQIRLRLTGIEARLDFMPRLDFGFDLQKLALALPRDCRSGRVEGVAFRFAFASADVASKEVIEDGSTVETYNRDALTKLLAYLHARSDDFRSGDYLLLAGQSDLSGDSGFNQRLSERRALNVAQAVLAKAGWMRAGLRPVGLGETATLWQEDPGSAQNRRVLAYHCRDATAGEVAHAGSGTQVAALD